MNRVMRMGVGLIALIPVLLVAGWVFDALGLGGEAGAWLIFGVGVVWVSTVIWWSLRAPAQVAAEDRPRYLAFLRHAAYQSLEDTDSDRRTR